MIRLFSLAIRRAAPIAILVASTAALLPAQSTSNAPATATPFPVTIRVDELAYEDNSDGFEQSTNDGSNVSRELPTGPLNVTWRSHLERSTHKSKTREA